MNTYLKVLNNSVNLFRNYSRTLDFQKETTRQHGRKTEVLVEKL
jgi:hypothetical protein